MRLSGFVLAPCAAVLALVSCTVVVEDRTPDEVLLLTPDDSVDLSAQTEAQGTAVIDGVSVEVLGGPTEPMFSGDRENWTARPVLGPCASTALYRYRVDYTVDYLLFTQRRSLRAPESGVFAREVIVSDPACANAPPPANGRLFRVNDTQDLPDSNPGDGVCAAIIGQARLCTLRAAVMEANAFPGTDVIALGRQRHVLTRVPPSTEADDVPNDAFGDLDITDSVVIIGDVPRAPNIGLVLKGSGDLASVGPRESLDRTDDDSLFARVDGGQISRVFQVHDIGGGNGFALFRNLAVVNGLDLDRPGGGIRNDGVLRLERVIVAENRLAQTGSSGGRFTSARGAGIANFGSLFATDLALVRNRFREDDGIAAALENQGIARLDRALITRNSGRFIGVILNSTRQARLTMINTMIVDNETSTEGGRIIQNQGQALLELYFSSVFGNRSTDPGFITLSTASGTTRLANTIISDRGQFDCVGSVVSQGRNIVANPNPACGRSFDPAGLGDATGSNVSIGSPANNGGFLYTTAIASPPTPPDPVDFGAGFVSAPAFDARGPGFERRRDGNGDGTVAEDAGAFEVQ